MNAVVTDLIGKRVSVSMWMTKGSPRDASGEMVLLITGTVRAVGSAADCFMVLVQTEIAHKGTRKVGALTMFSIGPRGGVEVVPVEESEAILRYRGARSELRLAHRSGRPQEEILNRLKMLWDSLSKTEQDLLIDEP